MAVLALKCAKPSRRENEAVTRHVSVVGECALDAAVAGTDALDDTTTTSSTAVLLLLRMVR